MNLNEAVSLKRLHHQLYPNHIDVERGFEPDLIKALEEKGHIVRERAKFAVIQAVYVEEPGVIQAVSDPRKGGKADGFWTINIRYNQYLYTHNLILVMNELIALMLISSKKPLGLCTTLNMSNWKVYTLIININ